MNRNARLMLLALALVMALPSCSFSRTHTVENQLEQTLALFAQRNAHTLTDEEALAILSAGGELDPAIVEEHLAPGDQAVPVLRLCRIIYLAESSGMDSRSLRGQNLVQLLSARQREDAAFGHLEETVFAAMTLENVGGSYDRDALLRLLITLQRPDGSFAKAGDSQADPSLTGQVLMLLACFSDDTRAETMALRAAAYLELVAPSELSGAEICDLLLGLLDSGYETDHDTVQALWDQLLACRDEEGGFSPTPGGTPDALSTLRGLMAMDALQRGGSLWNTLAMRESVISIEIRMPDGTVHYGNRLRLHEGDTALSATVRFCTTNGISLEYRFSEVLAIGEVRNAGQTWQGSMDGENISGYAALSPGDAVVWKWN